MRPAIEKKNLAMVEDDNSTAIDETGDDEAFSAKYIDESSRVRAVDLVKVEEGCESFLSCNIS